MALLLSLALCYQVSSPTIANPTIYNVVHKAWQNAYNSGQTKKTTFVYVDFSQPSTSKRLYVYDGQTNTLLYNTYVSHGAGSGTGTIPTRFSNVNGSKASSLGVQITKEFYQGSHGKNLRIQGLETWNNNAYSRYIEIHGASYIGNGRTGTSWGCYAVPQSEISYVLNLIGVGTIVVAYYPDANWLQTSKYLKG